MKTKQLVDMLIDVLISPFKLVLAVLFLIVYVVVCMIFGDDNDFDGWGTREFYGGNR